MQQISALAPRLSGSQGVLWSGGMHRAKSSQFCTRISLGRRTDNLCTFPERGPSQRPHLSFPSHTKIIYQPPKTGYLLYSDPPARVVLLQRLCFAQVWHTKRQPESYSRGPDILPEMMDPTPPTSVGIAQSPRGLGAPMLTARLGGKKP